MLKTKEIEYLFAGIQEEVIAGVKLSETEDFATCKAMRDYTIALHNGDDIALFEAVCRSLAGYWKTYFEESPKLADIYLNQRRQATKDLAKQASRQIMKEFFLENFQG